VYKGNERTGRWDLLTQAGALLFLRDASRSNLIYLRLIDLEAGHPIWEHELWVGFEYRQMEPYFHAFESDECVYGLMFADELEAGLFGRDVEKRVGKVGKGLRDGGKANGDDGASVRSVSTTNSSGRRGSFLKSIFGSNSAMTSEKHDEPSPASSPRLSATPTAKQQFQHPITQDDIGDPVGFKHLGHIGFNPGTGTFELDNIPPHWRKWLHASGASDADLGDRETATFIAGFLEKAVKNEEKAVASKGQRVTPNPNGKKGVYFQQTITVYWLCRSVLVACFLSIIHPSSNHR